MYHAAGIMTTSWNKTEKCNKKLSLQVNMQVF